MKKLGLWQKTCGLLVFWAAAAVSSPATTTFTTLVNFDGTNGAGPYYGSLVQGIDGNFYGTTESGGAYGLGTVFKMTAGGKLTTLYSFCAQAGCTDGSYPYDGLVQATNGNFYGTTAAGGANSAPACTSGCGAVFEITDNGKLTTLYSFCAQTGCTDGETPYAWLVQATDGNFYGTTEFGGTSDNCTNGCGTVFKITAGGNLTTLHSFGAADGEYPLAGLVQGNNGDFYGTTPFGGANGLGTVFEITAGGTLTTLSSFCSQPTCSLEPFAGLVQATNGNFYGTTAAGGDSDACGGYPCGTIFEITPGGTLTTLHSFDATDGELPYGGLVQATNGTFYGTTLGGGANDDGAIFSLGVGLGPFVETRPTSGKVGAKVTILGNGLTGATSVAFHGTAATITVDKSSEITTTVPTGATTGTVEVTTAKGKTLKSNVVFRVTP